MPAITTPLIRLVGKAVPSSFTLPTRAWLALQSAAVASSSRPLPFDELPAGSEEASVLSVWLTAILDGDPGTAAERAALAEAGHDFFGGEAKAAGELVRFLCECDGFTVEEVRPEAMPEPSVN
jgi:hypothetical protein